jgi:hypothetical protein
MAGRVPVSAMRRAESVAGASGPLVALRSVSVCLPRPGMHAAAAPYESLVKYARMP